MDANILLVEDDEFLRDGLCEMLSDEGCTVKTAKNAALAKSMFDENSFDLLILDVMLPDGNGFDICSYVREKNQSVPILFLTACDDEIQIVRGLDCGADDYVTKPFRLLELMSRIRALLRRNGVKNEFQCKDIVIDAEHMTVKKNGENIFVTPIEFQILSTLVKNSGKIVRRGVLLQSIWDNNNNFIDDNTLSVHISRLRNKIGAEHISTMRGVGYKWE